MARGHATVSFLGHLLKNLRAAPAAPQRSDQAGVRPENRRTDGRRRSTDRRRVGRDERWRPLSARSHLCFTSPSQNESTTDEAFQLAWMARFDEFSNGLR